MANLPTRQQVRTRAAARLFGGPLIQNNYRGEYVEEMIACVLSHAWTHCAADWSGWDFENANGVRMQVKQAAARQTWGLTKAVRFSIAPSTGYYRDGVEWIPEPGRPAELYVFAWHPGTVERVDHTDPAQWRFYIVPTVELPATKSISLRVLSAGRPAIGINDFARAVNEAVVKLATG
jgi:hypothetical protein